MTNKHKDRMNVPLNVGDRVLYLSSTYSHGISVQQATIVQLHNLMVSIHADGTQKGYAFNVKPHNLVKYEKPEVKDAPNISEIDNY